MREPPPGNARSVVIKRYANRRLYNTAALRYVMPDDVREMAEKGIDVVVYDAKTGENITQSFLAPLH